MRIDSHQHFWKYDPVRDSWIDDSMAVLKRDFLPQHLEEQLRDQEIDGCIAVQADQSENETNFLLKLAEKNPFIKGVVGWVDLKSDKVRKRLRHYAQNPLFKGVRHILQDEADDDFMLAPAFLNGIKALSEFNLTYDLLIFPRHLNNAIRLVEQFPNQRFVIDHIAKPSIKSGVLDPWKEDIKAIALYPNVLCKVSGLVTEADWHDWKLEDMVPFLDIVFEAFGPDRLMYGSDWPVCRLAGSYGTVYTLLEQYMKNISREDQQKIWGGNAVRFYNLNQWIIWKNAVAS